MPSRIAAFSHSEARTSIRHSGGSALRRVMFLKVKIGSKYIIIVLIEYCIDLKKLPCSPEATIVGDAFTCEVASGSI